ncbi:MAG: helix-turn-helix transcriptional regulator [Proteobacteria bacterium]|nr:helix-turn-helix transcriptional regulator [Pseudomonadota bacterium]
MSQVKDMLELLKRRMKGKGVTYQDLGVRLGVAESTIKRWFSTGSFDVSRLDQIAEIIEMDISELFTFSRKKDLQSYFNDEQELELSLRDDLLTVLYLSLSGKNFPEILNDFEITEQDLTKLLLKLDRLKLIELHPGQKIIPLVRSNTRWLPNGPLSQKYGSFIRQDYMNSDFSGQYEKFWLLSGKISQSSLKVFSRKFDLIVSELHDYMELDQDLSDSETEFLTFFSSYRPWKFPISGIPKRKR